MDATPRNALLPVDILLRPAIERKCACRCYLCGWIGIELFNLDRAVSQPFFNHAVNSCHDLFGCFWYRLPHVTGTFDFVPGLEFFCINQFKKSGFAILNITAMLPAFAYCTRIFMDQTNAAIGCVFTAATGSTNSESLDLEIILRYRKQKFFFFFHSF